MRLKVIKADGTTEEYLHTKVIGTISNALAGVGQPDICVAEELADVVTHFLYHKQNRRVTSSEIFSIIQVVLTETGYEEGAIGLGEHHFERKLRRCRIEVVSVDIREISDAEALRNMQRPGQPGRWDKSRIVDYLVTKHSVARQTARTIASMVEEKILNIGLTLVPAGLIKQLVLGDAAAVLRAERQLQLA